MRTLTARQPGAVVRHLVAVGDQVSTGDALLVLETMKFENTVSALHSGRVTSLAPLGEVVAAGEAVAVLSPVATAPTPAEALHIAKTVRTDVGDATFTELDLADESSTQLVPVHRALGAQDCGVVVGVISHTFPGSQRATERVWIAGDPTRSMGAVAEAECRRIIAAFDYADERGLSVEWVAVSAGARISTASGTENMDWCAAVVRRILLFTQAGGQVAVIVAGINVGAQSYWNSVATMLQHCAGLLVMVDGSAMVLTGHRALAMSGGVAARDDGQLGGYEDVMGPNGQAHHRARDLAHAYELVLAHHELTDTTPRPSEDPAHRDVRAHDAELLGCVGGRTPFAIRPVMAALRDADARVLERWHDQTGATGAVVWDTRIGGAATTVIGIESMPQELRCGPGEGQQVWAAGTLYPDAARKIARALTHASGHRPAVVLANLAGFDGSAWSLRHRQLEFGAEIARAVVNFDGPIVVVIIGRFHGGAYVVFNKRLNPRLRMLAVTDARVSVIGGSAAAEVVFAKQVRARAAELAGSEPIERLHHLKARADIAADFDAIHDVHRALQVGSIDRIIDPAHLRGAVIAELCGDNYRVPIDTERR